MEKEDIIEKRHSPKNKVLISYSSEDIGFSQKIEERLLSDGVEIWIDHDHIQGGDTILVETSKAIEWCDVVLLIWSKSASHSKYVTLEWTSAIKNDKRIIPCSIDDYPLSLILGGIHSICFKNFKDGYYKLTNALGLN